MLATPRERMPEPLFVLRVPRPSRGFLAALSGVTALALVRAGAVLDPHAAGGAAGLEGHAFDPRAGLAALCWAGAGAFCALMACLTLGPRRGGGSGGGRDGLRVIDGGRGDGGGGAA